MKAASEGRSTEVVAMAILAGQNLPLEEAKAYWAATDLGLRPKEETIAVLATLATAPPMATAIQGLVVYIAEKYPPVALSAGVSAVNIVGTGGGPSTFNISTAAAFVAAGAGARVLKSGSYAYSSNVGSQNMLAALGLNAPFDDECVDRMLGKVVIAFTPASRYAPICKRLAVAVMPLPFKAIGKIVNWMGPLIGPHRVFATVAGASSSALFEALAAGARLLGQRMLVVTSEAGADELIASGANRCVMTESGASWVERCGSFSNDALAGLAGGDLAFNKARLLAILEGKDSEMALATVAMNAGAALLMARHAVDIEDGEAKARQAIASGAALDRLRAAQDHVVRATGHRTLASAARLPVATA